MKKKTNVKTLIRQIVREEVAMAINEVITELKQPSQTSSEAIFKKKTKKKIVEKKNFSKNSVINDILNETSTDGWDTLGGETFDSSKMGDVLSSAYSDTSNNNPNGNLAAEMGVDPNNVPNFLTKDYRAIMKAVDNKIKDKNG